ncbi:hypothetical protein QBC38DRAFT_221165 [Podospora fimiseda]|uniref:Uncharacterized protein n=1 Tax=Podospora fimiseda TaxID=252190 RepID=A0AAN7BNI6_9PEZI|nr:hypothetical protein QBC38DRAFT_221165 [Podospora fimiseda]
MKQFTLIYALLLLFLSPQSILALPTPDDASVQADLDAAGPTTNVNGYTVRCKTAALLALCTAENANARCDVTGFHNDFMASCGKNCWCD